MLDEHGKQRTRSAARLLHSARPSVAPRPQFKQDLLRRMDQAQATAQAGAAQAGKAAPRRSWRNRRLYRISGSLAAALLLTAGAWWFVESQPVAHADFGQMLSRISKIRTVSYDTIHRQPDKEVVMHVTASYPYRMRVEVQGGILVVHDFSIGMAMTLRLAERRASLYEVRKFNDRLARSSGYSGEFDALRRSIGSDARFIHRQKIGPIETDLYEVVANGTNMLVWVDPVEQLPVRIEAKSDATGGQETAVVLTNFRWNEPLSDSMFSLQPPAGFSVTRVAPPTDRDLINLLAFFAKGNDFFPTSVDGDAYCQELARRYPGQVISGNSHMIGDASYTDIKGEALEVNRVCVRGAMFILLLQEEKDQWHYTGTGVRVGDASAVVCWWRLKGADTVKVVYGDLTIKEMPASDFKPPTPATMPGQ